MKIEQNVTQYKINKVGIEITRCHYFMVDSCIQLVNVEGNVFPFFLNNLCVNCTLCLLSHKKQTDMQFQHNSKLCVVLQTVGKQRTQYYKCTKQDYSAMGETFSLVSTDSDEMCWNLFNFTHMDDAS